jgi:SAM-dependent methyltransferase
MTAPTALTLVVPVFNEETRVGEFAPQLVEFVAGLPEGSALVFVDDGSTDSTTSLLDSLSARYPNQAVRVLTRGHTGKGAAIAAGLASATTAYAGFSDLDLSTPLADLTRVYAAATRAHVLAIGSRDLAGSTLVQRESRPREFLGRAYNRLLQATVTPGVVDTQCGAKVAHRSVWDDVLPWCREPGYAWDAEVIAIALALGVAVQEVPISWRHDRRSKVHVFSDGARMVRATPQIARAAARAKAARARVAGEVFDDSNAELLIEADRSHWWFRSKAAFVSTALRRTNRGMKRGILADVGAGAGGVTAMIGWDPERVVVVEGNKDLVAHARHATGLTAVRATVEELPLAAGAIDVVCVLDVLEHLADPGEALEQIATALAPGGRIVVNVPAHPWLWSEADEFLGHVRRYTRRALRAELARHGFEPVILTHVFSWLVPPVWLTRRVRRGNGPELGLDRVRASIDAAASVLTFVERAAIGRICLPFGTSVLCVAVKPA